MTAFLDKAAWKRRQLAVWRVLGCAVAIIGFFIVLSSAANAANYQVTRQKSCPAVNICTLSFPAPGGSLRIDYVTCKVETGTTNLATWLMRLWDGADLLFLEVQPQDIGNAHANFVVSNQVRYYTTAAHSISFSAEPAVGEPAANIVFACMVAGVVI